MIDAYSASLSPIDSERFGFQAAKGTMVAPSDVPAFLEFCTLNDVEFAIVRCSAQKLDIVQRLEHAGFFLTDTLVYYRRDLARVAIPQDDNPIAIRSYFPGDEVEVGAVAAESFKGYYGHYHADSRLDRAKCDEVYVDWAVRSCLSRSVADDVFIAEDAGRVVAFAAMKMTGKDSAEGVLFGVAPVAQGRGIYRSLHIQALHWSLARGASWVDMPTQVTNLASRKIFTRLGYEPSYSFYTLHKWFD